MSNGNDKFNMFENFEDSNVQKVLEDDNYNIIENEYDDTNENVEIISVTMKPEGRKKFASAVITRTQEDYESYIESIYFETHKHPVSGEDYQVKVTVLIPEINPQELLRPAYAYSTNH